MKNTNKVRQAPDEELLSLREIARRLDLPSSTVAYYKDRYRTFIPSSAGAGRRQRYGLPVLKVFKRIREMYDMSSSASQIERDLERRFGRSGGGSGEGAGSDPVTRLQERISGLLTDQTLFRREIGSLKSEVETLRARLDEARTERRTETDALRARLSEARSRHEAEADTLRREAAALRDENTRLADYIEKHIRRGNPLHSKPSEAFLNLPLVVRSERGEYLGVAATGRGTFTPKRLVALIQKSACATRSVEIHWDRDQSHWVLKVLTNDPACGREQALVFMLAENRTPSRNLVARLAHLIVDGNEVPDHFLLGFFRQLRESFTS